MMTMAVVGKSFKSFCLALIQCGVSLGVVADEDFYKRRTKFIDMGSKFGTIFKVKLILSRFLSRTSGHEPFTLRILQDFCSKLFIHQDPCFFLRDSFGNSLFKAFIDESLVGG